MLLSLIFTALVALIYSLRPRFAPAYDSVCESPAVGNLGRLNWCHVAELTQAKGRYPSEFG